MVNRSIEHPSFSLLSKNSSLLLICFGDVSSLLVLGSFHIFGHVVARPRPVVGGTERRYLVQTMEIAA